MAKRPFSKANIKNAAATADAMGRTHDSFQNFVASVGIGTDNQSSGATYGFNPVTRNRTELEWMYRGSWMVGQVVDTVADDMTRAGFDIQSEMLPEDVARIHEVWRNNTVSERFNDAIKWARLYGGSLAVPLIDGQDPSKPLRVEAIAPGAFRGLLILDRWMVNPSLSDLVTEYGDDLGMPKYYEVVADAPALPRMRIHHSRAFRIDGVDLPYWQKISENLWGMSVVERLFDRLVAFDSTTQGIAQLVYKAHLRTVQIENLRDIIGAGGAAMKAVVKNLQMIRSMQSNEGLTILDAKDKFETHQYSFTGLDNVLMQFGQQLSGATGIPLVRLFGQSPSGMNSTGESDIRNYYDNVKQQQERRLRRYFERTIRVIAQSEKIKVPEGFAMSFVPLWQLSDTEKVDIAAKVTETAAKATDSGIIGRKTALQEMKQSSRVTGYYTNITDEQIEAAEEEPPSPEEMMAMEDPDAGNPEQSGATGDGVKASKKKAGYIATGGKHVCADCSMFRAPNGCTAVEGSVAPGGCCDYWAARRGTQDAAGFYDIGGMPIVIETPRDTKRQGNGWSVMMPADYGYIRGTGSAEGRDEQMDCFVGPNSKSNRVWVVDQRNPHTGAFDEHKVMLGFDDQEAALDCYHAAFNDGLGFRRVGGITRMSLEECKAWLATRDYSPLQMAA